MKKSNNCAVALLMHSSSVCNLPRAPCSLTSLFVSVPSPPLQTYTYAIRPMREIDSIQMLGDTLGTETQTVSTNSNAPLMMPCSSVNKSTGSMSSTVHSYEVGAQQLLCLWQALHPTAVGSRHSA